MKVPEGSQLAIYKEWSSKLANGQSGIWPLKIPHTNTAFLALNKSASFKSVLYTVQYLVQSNDNFITKENNDYLAQGVRVSCSDQI